MRSFCVWGKGSILGPSRLGEEQVDRGPWLQIVHLFKKLSFLLHFLPSFIVFASLLCFPWKTFHFAQENLGFCSKRCQISYAEYIFLCQGFDCAPPQKKESGKGEHVLWYIFARVATGRKERLPFHTHIGMKRLDSPPPPPLISVVEFIKRFRTPFFLSCEKDKKPTTPRHFLIHITYRSCFLKCQAKLLPRLQNSAPLQI